MEDVPEIKTMARSKYISDDIKDKGLGDEVIRRNGN